MIEHYKGESRIEFTSKLEVSVSRTNDPNRHDATYGLQVKFLISDITFDVRFGKPGGYIGTQNLEDLIMRGRIEETPVNLHNYFQSKTPNLEADFELGTREIRIRRIERNAINPGQKFCLRTLKQLLGALKTQVQHLRKIMLHGKNLHAVKY